MIAIRPRTIVVQNISTFLSNAQLPTGNQVYQIYPPSLDGAVEFEVPADINITQFAVNVGYVMSVADAGNVEMSAAFSAAGEGQNPDVAPGGAITATVTPGNDTLYHVQTFVFTSTIASGSVIHVVVNRLGSDVNDTHPGDLRALRFWIGYSA